MVGSTCYSVSSFLYLMAVTRICGVELAGFYSLSYATAQLLLQVGRYGMRTYQATDLSHHFYFREYGISRVISCVMMLILGAAYSICSFQGEYIIISCFVVFMKMVDAAEDVFHGNLQQKYHVEEMGKLLAARNVYSMFAFVGSLLIWHSLYLTCVFTAVSSFLVCLWLNNAVTRRCLAGTDIMEGTLRREKLLELLKICTPLFLGTFLSLLLYNIPKYAMAGVLSDEYQTYYSVLFMPSFVITMMCEFVFKPTITTIAGLWWEKAFGRFARYVLTIIAIIAAADLFIIAGGHLLGRRLLELIYHVDLSPYKLHFIVLLAGGGFSAEVYMIYNILIAIRMGHFILPVYGLAAVLTILPAGWMVRSFGVMGACLNYLYSCGILFICFSVILFVVALSKAGKREG